MESKKDNVFSRIRKGTGLYNNPSSLRGGEVRKPVAFQFSDERKKSFMVDTADEVSQLYIKGKSFLKCKCTRNTALRFQLLYI